MAQTRNKVNCPIIGSPNELSIIILPTREDILRHYKWNRLQKENAWQYEPKVGEVHEGNTAKLQ